MIRIAAVADVHFGEDSRGCLRPHLEKLGDRADVFLIGGDLTRHGKADEAAVLADELTRLPVPVVSILGNHDYHSDEEKVIRDVLEEAGVTVLEGETATFDLANGTLGVAGVKGFCGGFPGGNASEFGEPEMKSFIRHTRETARVLRDSLNSLQTDRRVALIHYAPVEATLQGERLQVYPFLGSYLLAEAIDEAGADLVIHGHAHAGTEKGMTPGGVHVRNVAQPLLGKPYALLCLGDEDDVGC